ncbi:MAG: TorF family putative porin [Opitutaceae bacterium]
MKTIAIVFAGLLVTARLFAAEPQSSFTITADIPYVSKYVFRGVQLARDSMQPSVTVSSGDFSAGLWTNQPIVDNADNEFRLFAGYNIALGNDWKVNVGGTIYYFPELDKRTNADRDTYEPKVSLIGAVGPINSAVTLYRDTTLNTTTGEMTLGYSIPLQGINGSFDVTGNFGRVLPQNGPNYNYYGATAKFTFRVKENVSYYAGAIGAKNNLRGLVKTNHLVAITGITLTL